MCSSSFVKIITTRTKLSKLKIVHVKIEYCISPNCICESLQNLANHMCSTTFVKITNCICQNSKYFLSKLKIVSVIACKKWQTIKCSTTFVKIINYVCQNYQLYWSKLNFFSTFEIVSVIACKRWRAGCFQLHLSKLQIVFVKITNCYCQNWN